MDFNILYAIQSIRTPILDNIILALTKIMGSYGEIWLIVAAILLIFRKTRKCGICILISYALVYLVGQFGLKDLIARPRPCHLDETVALLVERPESFSCPSTHSAWAFAAAVSIFYYFRKPGIAVIAVAAVIGFSRMYLFVHFPTDVLLGIVLGVLMALITCKLTDRILKKRQDAKKRKTEA